MTLVTFEVDEVSEDIMLTVDDSTRPALLAWPSGGGPRSITGLAAGSSITRRAITST